MLESCSQTVRLVLSFFLGRRLFRTSERGGVDFKGGHLVAPFCAIPRDYLSDTPLLRAMGFLVSQHGELGAIPPPPFLSVSPLEGMRSGVAIPHPEKAYLSDTCVIPYENKANVCDTPLCDRISKEYCAIWGGISHWAAKGRGQPSWLFRRFGRFQQFWRARCHLFVVLQITAQRGNRDGFDGFMAVSVMMATPLSSSPLFRHSDLCRRKLPEKF